MKGSVNCRIARHPVDQVHPTKVYQRSSTQKPKISTSNQNQQQSHAAATNNQTKTAAQCVQPTERPATNSETIRSLNTALPATCSSAPDFGWYIRRGSVVAHYDRAQSTNMPPHGKLQQTPARSDEMIRYLHEGGKHTRIAANLA